MLGRTEVCVSEEAKYNLLTRHCDVAAVTSLVDVKYKDLHYICTVINSFRRISLRETFPSTWVTILTVDFGRLMVSLTQWNFLYSDKL